MPKKEMVYAEKRSESRTLVDVRVEIIDRHSRESIGILMDLSASGFMLSTDLQIEIGTLHQLCFVFPEEDSADTACLLNIGAEANWKHAAPSGSHCWMGFHIIDISESDLKMIREMVAEWQAAA